MRGASFKQPAHVAAPSTPEHPAVSRRALLGGGWVVVGGLLLPRALRADGGGFRLVVHPKSPHVSLARDFVADALLKKVTRWSDGEQIQPVDQRSEAACRRVFSDAVLKRSVAAVKMYWQQRIFSGRGVPPPELDDDAAVLAYVASHRAALGYVSEAAKLDTVKVVSLR